MPRKARKKSESGIYHIMMRGINRQNIFEDDEDNMKFLQILEQYRDKCGYDIYAYCLMGNHVHLLLRDRYLKELKEKHSLSIRQIERLTGINRGVVQKV